MAAPAIATDPAGALIDAATFAKMKALALHPQAYLDNNDATTFFEATGDLLHAGTDADERERYQGDFGGLRRLPRSHCHSPRPGYAKASPGLRSRGAEALA